MSIITYPLDGKYYNAQDAETYLCTRTSGVFSEEISFTPNGMNITVSPFLAWIKNDDFSGKSVAVTTNTTLTIPPSEPILSRIDMIVLRFDARKNSSELMVLKGTPSSSPSRPSIERTPVVYDLGLCQILVKPSATSISASNITSTLLDESLCGIMSDGVTRIPTSTLQTQVMDLIKELEVAISMAENGSPVLQSLGIKRGTVDVTIGTKGPNIYKSDDVKFDTIFLDAPKVIVTRKSHYLDKIVFEDIKPQEVVRAKDNGFSLEVFSEKDIPTELTLRYNWIAIGKVSWDNDGGGGGDDDDEEDDTKYFTISTSVEPSGSGTTEGAGNFAKGSTTKLVARASSGYTFEGWYLGNSKEASTATYIVTVNSNATYTAKFIEEDPSIEDSIDVKINVEPAAAGNVTGAGTYPKGSTVNLKATPKSGYKFVGWYALDRLYSDSADYSVTLNGSITFTAVFEADTATPGYYTITTEVTPSNGGTVTGGGTYEEDTVVTLKATPNSGYYFLYWTNGTETRQTETTEVYATENQTWTAVFEVDSEGGEPTYATDTIVDGTLYVGTQTTNIETDNSYAGRTDITQVIIPEGRTKIGTHTLKSCSNLAKVTMPSTMATINMGAFDGCSRLTEITYNGTKSQWNNVSKYMAFDGDLNDITVHCTDGDVNYQKIEFYITPENAGSITTSPKPVTTTTGDIFLVVGGSMTYTATPNSGYKFKEWTYGGLNTWTDNPVTLPRDGITQPPVMNAVFEKINTSATYYTVTVQASPTNGGTVSGGGTYEEDTVVTLKATPNSGYYFLYWTNGTETRMSETTEVYATENQTWTAVFEEDSGEEETTYTSDTIVDGVLYIGTETTNLTEEYSFENRKDFTRVVIPEGVNRISAFAFGGCSNLTTVRMPNSMNEIEYSAFTSCGNLTDIYYNGTKAQWNNVTIGQIAFDNLSTITIHCTDGNIEYYNIKKAVSPSGAGNISSVPQGIECYEGFGFIKSTSITWTASPNSGYEFDHWNDTDEDSTKNPWDNSAWANYTMTAVFEADTVTPDYYTITTKATPENGGTVTGGGTYEEDTVVTLKATPNSGYYFLYWTNGTETRQTETTEVYATSNQTWTAVFEKGEITTYTVTTHVEPSGAGTATGGGSGFAIGDYTSLEATANSGYRFLHWRNAKGDTYTDNPLRIGVAGNTTFTAVFEKINTSTETKNIEIRCGGSAGGTTEIKRNGVVVHDSGDTYSDTFNYGEEVTLTAKFGGDNLSTFNDWENYETGQILSTNNPYTFTVGSDTPNKIGMGLRSA